MVYILFFIGSFARNSRNKNDQCNLNMNLAPF